MKIYLASSWRNQTQPFLIDALEKEGYEVYDFRNPRPGDTGFHWSEIDSDWKVWSPEAFKEALNHPLATNGFASDWEAMLWADICILVLPCGRSAHLEAGYFIGAGKPLHIFLSDGEPELMYKMATGIHTNAPDLFRALKAFSQ